MESKINYSTNARMAHSISQTVRNIVENSKSDYKKSLIINISSLLIKKSTDVHSSYDFHPYTQRLPHPWMR